ncbi:hypothetical protein JTE90_015867 [Oedothorax gibbosus]|uniref:Uncharacterized protein n=1 Tax=Oedothorax gibbosus TaxID=931172 RepID=A0AAV6VVP4_9ARAC|nr:hypothetical protein JTE90_015867 [Oedothorax gibbosus]
MEESKISAKGDSHQIDTSEPETDKPVGTSRYEPTTKADVTEPHEIEGDTSEVSKRNDNPENNSDSEDNFQEEHPEKEEEETKVPLMQEDTVDIKLEGEDTPTLPISKKNKDVEPHKKKPPIYLFPITRMRLAWTGSSSICDFVLKATLIIFSTLGWMFCVGGLPFVSLAMLIIGIIYIDDCTVQPNIPVYLVVSGVFGTVQHAMSLWTKYIPKDSQGRLKVFRSYCRVIDGVISIFLTIWFVLGCIWVYGVKEVEFKETYKLEYCNKTLYYFAFWVMNISFIVLSLLIVLSLCCILCIVSSPRDEEKGIVQ